MLKLMDNVPGKQIDVGYGLLDMRNGQELPLAWHQVHETTVQQPGIKAWFFDIIHTPNQTPMAFEWQDRIRDMINEETGLTGDKIDIRLQTNTKKLRAQNDLYKIAYERNIATVDQKVIK